jgi:hypothetical protein
MNLDGTFNGELIGYDISLNSGAVVNQSDPSIPEPSTWVMLLLGFAGLGFTGFSRFAESRVAVGA